MESKARTRERLLNAAALLFTRLGFAGASIDDIADAAGCTKGAFYANFGSKEDAYLALMERHGREAAAERRRFFRLCPDGAELQSSATRHMSDHAREWDWLLLDVEFKLAATRASKLKSRLARARRGVLAQAVADLKEFSQRMGRPLSTEPRLLCTALEALLEGLALIHKLDHKALNQRDVEKVLKLFAERVLLDGAELVSRAKKG